MRDRLFARLGIGSKLALACSALAGVTVVVVILALLAGWNVTQDIDLADGERLPGSVTSERAQASLLRMQLHVRGYLVLGDAEDAEGYREHKLLFEHDLSKLRLLAQRWPQEDAALVAELVENYGQWSGLPQKLFELHDDPLTNRPALRLLRYEVQPRRDEVSRRVEGMFGASLGVQGTYSALRAEWVAFEASFDAMVSSLLALAVSGDASARLVFERQLAAANSRWQRLQSQRSLLGASDREAFAFIQRRRAEVGDIARRIVDIAGSDRALEDLYLYRTRAEPLTQSMLRVFGTLTARQQARMQEDLGRARERLRRAALPATLGGLLAMGMAVLLAATAQRRIARPIQRLVEMAEQVATGAPVERPAAAGSDEITRLSQTLNTRLRKEELQHLMASISDAVWSGVLSPDGALAYRYLSPVIERIAGRPPQHFLAAGAQWLDAVHPEDRVAVAQELARIANGSSAREDAEYRIERPDGVVRWVRDSVRATRLETGEILLNGVLSDITERKAAQEHLLHMERQLRQAQRLEAIGTLAGGIAHDFNNILAAILGYGERVLRESPRGSRMRNDLASIVAAGERGRALVDRILAFSRSGLGERVPVHVEGVVAETLELLAASTSQSIAIERALTAGRAAIRGDPTQIHQVLMNLATNGLQAMPFGGILRIALTVAAIDRAGAATAGSLHGGDYVVLSVADSGVGMTADVLQRMFDPFFTTKDVGVGTGLGLSLVHAIVMDLDGAIDVKSSPGQGSTFTVYLPREGDAPTEAALSAALSARGDNQQILIVDDEEALARLASAQLTELGYVPVAFSSSTAALEAFRAYPHRYDALVTDERMPGLHGSALIRQVREARADIPIILVTGFADADLLARAKALKVDEVLEKPLGPQELAAALARVLGRRDPALPTNKRPRP